MTAVPAAREGAAAELVLAADAFLVAPKARRAETIMAQAEGQEPRTVIAGYHWFTDWGRDTMISLEGLTLCTHRVREAGYILRTFAHYVRDGLIPNMFPDGQREGLYHTADASLWFFHAVERYTIATGDDDTLRKLLRRHRLAVAAAALLALLATASAVTLAVMYGRQGELLLQVQTEAAKSKAISSFLEDMLGRIDPQHARGRDVAVLRELLDVADTLPTCALPGPVSAISMSTSPVCPGYSGESAALSEPVTVTERGACPAAADAVPVPEPP